MTDLDEAKELLMALTKEGGSTEPTSLHRAVMLLLVDYIQRNFWGTRRCSEANSKQGNVVNSGGGFSRALFVCDRLASWT